MTQPPWVLVESERPFAESLVWERQRRYFVERGIDAWRNGLVPSYATSHPAIASRYAEIVFAFWRDQSGVPSSQPLYVCELGAGSGRFAFHFLQHLEQLCESADVPLSSFVYVLTDIAEKNLAFWRAHPSFATWFAAGVLDVAPFDATHSAELDLRVREMTLAPDALERPLVVIANYVFDSIPADLLFVAEQRVFRCTVSLIAPPNTAGNDDEALPADVRAVYDRTPLGGLVVPNDTHVPEILEAYRLEFDGAYVLFPDAGLRAAQNLRALSSRGMLLLTADKGQHRLADVGRRDPPLLQRHGSFSLDVNYHAFAQLCELGGGRARFPDFYGSLAIGALLFVEDPQAYRETQAAYERAIVDFGPDDVLEVAALAHREAATLSFGQLLAYLRLGGYSQRNFLAFASRLEELAPTLDARERAALIATLERVWERSFPLGEEPDIAFTSASLLYHVDAHAEALLFFQRSVEHFGEHIGTTYNMAVCQQLLGKRDDAMELLRTVLRHDPAHADARRRLKALGAKPR